MTSKTSTGRGKINTTESQSLGKPGSRKSSSTSPSSPSGISTGEADIGKMQMRLLKVSPENEKQKKDLDKANKDVSDLQKKLLSVSQEKEKQQKELDKFMKALSDLQKKFQKASDENEKHKKDLDKANKDLPDLQKKLLSVSQEKAKQQKELDKYIKDHSDLQKRMAIISEEKNKHEKNLKLQQTNMKAERETLAENLKKKVDELNACQNKLSTALAECNKGKEEYTALKAELNTALAECNKVKTEYKDLKAQTTNQINELTSANDELSTRLHTAETECKQRVKELNGHKAESSNKIQELTAANDELRTRLSKHFGAKLQDNNPNIADLSDSNRPTKLAEQFSELYDNEWTNSFEVVKKHKTEVDVVDMLLTACVQIYSHCIAEASTELQDLHRVFLVFNSESDVQSQKQLKDRRKKIKPDQQLQSKIAREMNDLFGEKNSKHKKIIPYVQKCLDICWSMAIQDPPVDMDTRLNMNGQPFDNAAYRPYTQSGPSVDFIVWPALYLHKGGCILQKGIAQGMIAETSVGGRKASPVNKKHMVEES